MDERDFWAIVDDSRRAGRNNFRVQVQLIGERIGKLPPIDALSFAEHWIVAEGRAYRWAVWDAARLLLGWLGDDSFVDFTAWLIAQGRTSFERVIANPDSLADFVDVRADAVSGDAEDLGNLIHESYERMREQLGVPAIVGDKDSAGPTGEAIDLADDHAVKARFPRLAALSNTPMDQNNGDEPASPSLSNEPSILCTSCAQPLTRKIVSQTYPSKHGSRVLQYRRCVGCRSLYWRYQGERDWSPTVEADHSSVDVHIMFDAIEKVGLSQGD